MRRSAKSRTADLFAAEYRPAVRPGAAPAPAALPARVAIASPQPASPQTVTRTLNRPRSRQLWYAVVFEGLAEPESLSVLQKLCLHAQAFTSFVSIEPPNALLLEIKGSVKLFGSLRSLHADMDACWRQLALPARSATAPSTLAALWLARAGAALQIEDSEKLPGHLAKLPIACTAWDDERLQTLRAMGVTSLGELMRLPRAGLARRLNPALVQELDVALARQ